jgi:hypothetical protein
MNQSNFVLQAELNYIENDGKYHYDNLCKHHNYVYNGHHRNYN